MMCLKIGPAYELPSSPDGHPPRAAIRLELLRNDQIVLRQKVSHSVPN